MYFLILQHLELSCKTKLRLWPKPPRVHRPPFDPSDNFFDPTAGSNNIRVSTKIKRDLAVDMERRSGGF
jgi:hypothetical protein